MGFGIRAALRGRPTATELEPLENQDTGQPLDMTGYVALARRAGFNNADQVVYRQKERLAERQGVVDLRQFLSENGIAVYDDRAVTKYMNSITPIRYAWSWTELSSYYEPIPEAVLMTMAKIRQTIPSVSFQVTHIHRMPDKDPFLRCGFHGDNGGTWFIIERWDEPKFRQ